MKKFFILFFLLFSCSLFSLEVEPWLGDIYEFDLTSRYTYSYFSSVSGARPSLSSTSNDHLLYFDLEFPFSPVWSIDVDLQFIDTPRQSFSFRSTAMQLRYLFLDDIIGDVVSLTAGGDVRYVSSRSLHDISSPYHGRAEFEASFSIGKEYDYQEWWRYRIWAHGLLGIANKRSPWMRAILGLESNYDDRHRFGLFLEGLHGFGKRSTINIADFHGYGSIRHKSIDLTLRYGHNFDYLGVFRAEYTRRLLAKRFPERVNFFSVSYLYPFSF